MSVPWRRSSGIDPDARAYCLRSGATDRRVMSDWVRGLKGLALWEQCAGWTFLPGQCAGTGSVAHTVGGLYSTNGTLVNGPTWGRGLTMTAANAQYIATGTIQNAAAASIAVVCMIPSSTTVLQNNLFGDYGGFSTIGSYSLHFGSQNNGNSSFAGPSNPFTFSGNGSEGGINKGSGYYKDDKYHFLALSGNRAIPSNEFFQDGEFLQKFPTSANGILGQQIYIGGVVNPPTATFAAALYFPTRLSQAQWAGVYQLYRSTLGKDLGLL
ncbi:hypothetical protein TSACC_3698 [Terrimicrobium sacchariphilum]|uniref:Uncharacterized protein n=2 Tax=Terrimicrobium sacchariphilum TaxID=690879 RepID=A0A146G7H1_TERSA|nr:hypothetical protein [Terrimicrobium sacchariphilum]GAT33303.1 hypothetical protein TSACC_21716 [Terrimicrobium sacchariphilum]GAT35627.1 hypothetical protein TSACC_3698 [Terrimicrobium sacchariphilum]